MTDRQPSRRTVLGLLGAGTAGVLGATGTAAAATPPVPKDLRPGGSYDRHLQELADAGEFSGTVLFAHQDRPVLSRSHGMAIKEDGAAPDLQRFAHALRSGALLDPALTELYWSAKSPNPPRSQNPDGGGTRPTAAATVPRPRGSFHSYGGPVALYGGRWVFSHGGGAAGESTNWTIYRDTEWTTVVLANHDGFDLQSLIDHERRLVLAT